MKYIFSQMAYFMAEQSNRRNMRFVTRFAMLSLLLVLAYSVIFHFIMLYEGREYSGFTGVYWTLTVMSTLGFGDITFNSDLGKVFSSLVLLSGVLLFMLVLPFTFIRFVYSPWLDAQSKSMVPKSLPPGTTGHVLVVGSDSIAISIVKRLTRYNFKYAMLIADQARALELFDQGYKVVAGQTDDPDTYANLRLDEAALVVALEGDLKNTNIAATVREVAMYTPLAGSVEHVDSVDILHLAGCNHVYYFAQMLGQSLARRVFESSVQTNIIGRFQDLCIAEAPVQRTHLAGKTLREADLRKNFGLNVVGVWQGNQYMPAKPDTTIDEGAVLLLAGTADLMEIYDQSVAYEREVEQKPVLILGGGKVGNAVAQSLEKRGVPFCVVEKNAALVPQGDKRYIYGSAADIDTLRRAGIESTHTVIVTTHNDDLNIYLTIYCRKLRPDVQIITRATLDRNVASLYNAGANLVMSHSTLAANAIINLLSPDRIFMLTEGLNIFKIKAPTALRGLSLIQSNIRRDTDCNVVAVRSGEKLLITPDPARLMEPDDELILIGSVDAEQEFMRRFMDDEQGKKKGS